MNLDFNTPKWDQGYYQDQTPPRSCARPWQLTNKCNTKAALLIHGYAGYPGELIRVGKELHTEGFDAFGPRLPGNGTSGADFRKSKARDWLGVLRTAMDDLIQRYEEVLIVGHSMGGALAATIAAEYHSQRLILIAPGLLIPSIPVGKLKLIAPFVKKIAIPWQADPEYSFYYESEEDDDAYLGSEYWSWVFPKTVLELEKVRKEAVKNLPLITARTLVLTGEHDLIVPHEVTALVKEKVNGEVSLHHIIEAGHYIIYDKSMNAQDEAFDVIRRWIKTP